MLLRITGDIRVQFPANMIGHGLYGRHGETPESFEDKCVQVPWLGVPILKSVLRAANATFALRQLLVLAYSLQESLSRS